MIPLRFKTSYTSCSIDIDVLLVVNKRINRLAWGSNIPNRGVGVSYLKFPELSEQNIVIHNKGGAAQNTDIVLTPESERSIGLTGNNKTFKTKVYEFLLTDVYNELPGDRKQPLYYRHDLIARNNERVTEASAVRVLDQNMKDVDTLYWKTSREEDTGGQYIRVYHCLLPNVEKSDIYYLTYRDQNGEPSTVLLKNTRVFRRLDQLSESPLPGEKTYRVTPSASGVFSVQMNFEGGIVWFKPIIDGQIRVYRPQCANNKTNWKLKVSSGSFISTTIDGDGIEKARRYSVPEFYGQPFLNNKASQRIRFTPIYGEANKCQILNRRVVVSNYKDWIVDTESFLYLTVAIADKNGQFYDGYTNNPYQSYWQTPDGSQVVALRDLSVLQDFSYNAAEGMVYLAHDIKLDDRVYVNVHYREKFFHYTDLELNPVFNPAILDNMVIIYIRPQYILNRSTLSDDPIRDRGLYHFVIDNTGRFLDYPLDEDGDPLDPDLKKSGVHNWYDYKRLYPQNLFLSEIFVGRFSTPQEVIDIDIRTRGGGIKKDVNRDTLFREYPESAWFADIGYWDGKPYPGSMAMVLDVPHSITKAGGGRYSKEEIEGVIKKHIVFGAKPLVQYYGEKPNLYIGRAERSSSTVTLYLWWSFSAADRFNIYRVSDRNEYTLIGTSVSHSTIIELSRTSNDIYNICVEPIVNNETGLKSNILKLKAG